MILDHTKHFNDEQQVTQMLLFNRLIRTELGTVQVFFIKLKKIKLQNNSSVKRKFNINILAIKLCFGGENIS